MDKNDLIRDLLYIAAGAAAGAAAMYWLDPRLGAERRGALRGLVGAPGPSARMRQGSAALPRFARTGSEADDARLRDRVRARLGALVSHPGAIDVQVDNAVVRLSGHVLGKELDGLLFQVRHVPGVDRVINALTAHESPDALVAAQGSGSVRRRRVQPA